MLGQSSITSPWGDTIAETDVDEDNVFADIGEHIHHNYSWSKPDICKDVRVHDSVFIITTECINNNIRHFFF